MARHHEKIKVIRQYKKVTGETAVDMKKVAEFAISKMGWKIPPPTDPIDRLAQQFTQAAREETRYDKKTGKPYRANHAITATYGSQQLHLWIDIDDNKVPRKHMHKSLIARREQMVGDGLQLTYDANHWNSIHPEKEPIQICMDFTEDIEERMNVPEDKVA